MRHILSKIFSGLALLNFSFFSLAYPVNAGLLEPLLQPELQSFPACNDTSVLAKIVEKFNWAEDNTWHRGFRSDDIEETYERTVLDSETRLIPRRYCRGHALLTNGNHPTVFYLIEGGQGFAGTGFGVTYCVNGLDPWHTNDGSCRVLRH